MRNCFRSRSKVRSLAFSYNQPTQKAYIIEISSKAGGRRVALASFDHGTEEDILSQGMADILGMPVLPIEKESRSACPTDKEVYGETTLVWSLEKDTRRTYSGIFYVSSEQDPYYDVVLGKESAKKLESSTKRSRRSSARSWFR